jgi:hypothetical protein
LPAVKNALKTRFPLEIDRSGVAIVKRDHTAVVDLLIAASGPPCPICNRKPPKGAPVHATCRVRLLHALDEGKPFTKPRSQAYQDDCCTVCLARPRVGVTCAHCTKVLGVCRSLGVVR